MTETTVVPPSSVVRGSRRAAIIAIIVSLVISAALGIFALLSGDFGALQTQVLLTTLTIAAFGTTALCHLAVVTRSVRVVGFVGIGASVGAAISALVLIWVDWSVMWEQATGWAKALELLAIVAVSLAQANLLLLLAGRPHRLIRIALAVTLAAIAAVAVMLALRSSRRDRSRATREATPTGASSASSPSSTRSARSRFRSSAWCCAPAADPRLRRPAAQLTLGLSPELSARSTRRPHARE